MKKLSFFLLLLLVVFTAQAQIQEPVKFKTELKTVGSRSGNRFYRYDRCRLACIFYRFR